MTIRIGDILKLPANLHAELERRSDENAKEVAGVLMDKFTGKRSSSSETASLPQQDSPEAKSSNDCNQGMSGWNDKWGW